MRKVVETVFKVSDETKVAELVRRIIAGDRQAEEEIVRRYREGVSMIISRIVQNPSNAEDISQETFLKSLEKIRKGDVREPERLSGFICSMARNLALDYMRKIRQAAKQEDIGMAEQVPDPAPNQFDELYQKERAEIIRRVIDELNVKRDRDLILRYYIAEEDKDQICADLGLTREQFNRVIFRAHNRYKELYLKLIGNM